LQKTTIRKQTHKSNYLQIKTTNMSTQEKIIKAFETAGKPLRAGEVAEIAGLEKKDVEKEIKKMKDAGTLYSPVRCFYDLKK